MILRSDQYDDVYFSAQDGMAETQHVFIEGNNLPKAWEGRANFTIAETGFGTGLNFLTIWDVFEKQSESDQHLHFISVEKHPLSKVQIRNALKPWAGALGDRIERFLSLYPIRVPGPHHIHISERVSLTVWFGDVDVVMPEWAGQVDAWFLDGFTPAKNPAMWSESVFENMARLSHTNTTFATFTAAGFVKRGLEAVGFSVEKAKGFGRKRDMMQGRYSELVSKSVADKVQGNVKPSIVIIGGGLAGCALAYVANRAGMIATIYEAGDSLAVGASGGQKGMVNPKLTAVRTAQSDYFTAAYAHALRLLPEIHDIDFAVHGTKHLCTDDDKNRRFTGYINNLGWHADHLYRDADNHMIYPDAASVCPEKLCHAMAKGADIKLNMPVTAEMLAQIQGEYDCIVLANGHAVNTLLSDDLPVNWVRGQVSWIKPQADITQNLSYGGYVTPETPEGFHVLGSTLNPKNDDVTLRDEDHQEVLNRYNNKMNKNLTMDDVIGGWAALRTSSKDRFPIVGEIADNMYVSTAHGSHGIISSLYGAQIVMARITKAHLPVTRDVLSALSPKRFHKH